MIYLDAAATTKPKQEVIEVMMPYFNEQYYNPSSLYSPATKIKEDIERARKIVGNFIGANNDEIYFTSSGSEANCWMIQGFINRCNRRNKEATIITSTIEHKSIMECVKHMNVDVHYVDVDKFGFINMRSLELFLHNAYNEAKEILVSIQFANNEIGTIQNILEIAKLVHKYDGLFHTDAVQAIGQIPIDVKELEIDMLSCSGHKLGAPKGIGFLYKKNGIEIDPLIYGSQMDNMRGGTENTAYIIGMAKAIELCDISESKIIEMYRKRDYFTNELVRNFRCTVNGSLDSRLPNNINVVLPDGVSGESTLLMLDMSNIFISTSSACNSHSILPSHVLKSAGLNDDEAQRSIRITLSDDITYEDIDYFISELDKIIKIIKN